MSKKNILSTSVYLNKALYINVWASVIQTIHLSEHFYHCPRHNGVQITKGLLYTVHDVKSRLVRYTDTNRKTVQLEIYLLKENLADTFWRANEKKKFYTMAAMNVKLTIQIFGCLNEQIPNYLVTF